jgi:uncharacterized membrane protein
MTRFRSDWGAVRLPSRPVTMQQEKQAVRHSNGPCILMLITIIALNVAVLTGIRFPLFRPIAGFWFLFILPVYLFYTTSIWHRCDREERLAYSVCSVLLTLILMGLGINTILPLAGVERPLDTNEILLVGDLINLSLYLLRRRYPEVVKWRSGLAEVGREEVRLLVLSLVSVALAVFGANRLNNGAGDQLTLVALGAVAAAIVLTLRWIKLLREAVLGAVIYLTSLSLLLSTSLRGWYVTGHDIQEEYHVFQLTAVHGRWSMTYFHDAYSACLSITILPTELARIVDVDDPYVFKLFFQLIFALCPVFVYGIARRYFSPFIAVLSVAYFIGFPTFFTDMSFLNRQEIGLLFVAVGAFVITNRFWSSRRRQVLLVADGIGVELSHYSSMYVFVGILVIALGCRSGSRLMTRFREGGAGEDYQRGNWAPKNGTAVTFGTVAMLVGIIFIWGGLATGTSGQVLSAGKSAIFGLSGGSSGGRSGNVSFSLFGGGTVSPNVDLQIYRNKTAAAAAHSPSAYLPESAVDKAVTPYVAPQVRPLTVVGSALSKLKIPVEGVNALTRNLIADSEQLFLLVGLVRLLLLRWRDRRPVAQDLLWLAIGSLGVIGLITVLPSISADYGVLRAFQEALIFFCPVIVVGSVTIFQRMGQWRAQLASAVVCLVLFANTTGLVPQVLGGNLAELNLNNSGTYYDLYYMRPQDESAVAWLGSQPHVTSYPIQAGYIPTKYLFTNPGTLNGAETITDLYPTLVRQNSWVILGYPTVGSGPAYTFNHFDGNTIEYEYPIELLNRYKNLVYVNGEAEIYK